MEQNKSVFYYLCFLKNATVELDIPTLFSYGMREKKVKSKKLKSPPPLLPVSKDVRTFLSLQGASYKPLV
jgi:hypothetical protein